MRVCWRILLLTLLSKTIVSNERKPSGKCENKKKNNIIADDYGIKKKKNLPSYGGTPNAGEFVLENLFVHLTVFTRGVGRVLFFFFRFSTGTLSKSERTGRNPENCNINFAGLRPV